MDSDFDYCFKRTIKSKKLKLKLRGNLNESD